MTELGQTVKLGAAIGAVAHGAVTARDGLKAVMAGKKSKREVAEEVVRASAGGALDGGVKGAAMVGLREVALRVAPRFARGLAGQTVVTAVAIVGVDLAKEALKLRRGEITPEEFRDSAVASAVVAGASVVAGAAVAAVSIAVAGPVLAGGLALGASVAAGYAVEARLRPAAPVEPVPAPTPASG